MDGQLALGSSEASTPMNAVGNDRRVAMRGASAVSVMLELSDANSKREVVKGGRGSGAEEGNNEGQGCSWSNRLGSRIYRIDELCCRSIGGDSPGLLSPISCCVLRSPIGLVTCSRVLLKCACAFEGLDHLEKWSTRGFDAQKNVFYPRDCPPDRDHLRRLCLEEEESPRCTSCPSPPACPAAARWAFYLESTVSEVRSSSDAAIDVVSHCSGCQWMTRSTAALISWCAERFYSFGAPPSFAALWTRRKTRSGFAHLQVGRVGRGRSIVAMNRRPSYCRGDFHAVEGIIAQRL